MKLRKVLAVILLSLVVFAFPSCDFLSGMFGGGEAWEPGTPNEPVEPQTPPDTEDGNAYLGYPTSTSGSNVQLIKHNGYTLLYSYDDLIPLWILFGIVFIKTFRFMLTSTAVCTAVYLYCLSIAVLFFAFCPDMAQFPPVMTDIIVLILKDSVCHVVILPDVFSVLWSSFFVTLVAKKYRLATMLPFVPRMVCDSR